VIGPLWAALALVAAAGAVFGVGYSLLAAGLVGRFFARPSPRPVGFPPVTVVKPLHGAEAALLDNLSSFCRQDYAGPVQFLFGVADPADPALAAVAALRQHYPEATITVVADGRQHGTNRKVSNLLNTLPAAEHEILVFADSDVGVAPDYLSRVVGALQQPGVGLVTCLYRGKPDPGFWTRLSANATNYQFLPGVATGLALGRARPCFGQTIALRRETLRRAGGFERFRNHLAEDHAIGEAVRETGARVVIPPFVVSHACPENSLAKLVTHELRWSRTIRAVDPRGHLGFALSHPLAFALLAIGFSGGARWAWALAAVAWAARVALKVEVDRWTGEARRDYWLLPLSDLIGFGVFAASFASKRVVWRGHQFKVDGSGCMTPMADE
jgi:ceramide glucosyltransferase